MSKVVRITGGVKLRGSVTPIPNKNSLVAVLPAAILTDEVIVYHDLPDTSDVAKILKILEMMGASVSVEGTTTKVCCKNLNTNEIDEELGGQFRASLMFAGPLLARFGKARIPVPGGCDLGYRSISAHMDAFKSVGVTVNPEENWVRLTAPKKLETTYRVWQLEASVTATENLLMYAAGTESEFDITEAACEPHVVDLEKMLQVMGAKVEGLGSNRVKINGSKSMKGAEFKASPDFVDIAGYMVAAGVTDGEIKILGANIPEIVDGLIRWFTMFGLSIERDGEDLVVKRQNNELKIDWENTGFPLAGPELPKLAPRPWPGFPVDVIPVMATLSSKTRGKLLLQNWMYEYGLDFVRELNALGADILTLDPQKIIINGPIKFKGGDVTPPQVIQAVKAVFLAALADDKTTVIKGVEILQRRYPDIFEVYRSLGAKIEEI